ncbi:MAG TPA: hypothetical protein VGV35_17000, partial [Bryobacteraceae bacterium]|nr:hypothetical protein [Bryobacteraceae bacterium]
CVSNGQITRRYDQLVSTMPIQDLAHALDGTPSSVIAAVDSLRYNSLVTVAVGLDAARLPAYSSIYVPDPAIAFHRLSFPGEFSPHNVPAGQSIIEAEITTNPGDGTHEESDEQILADVIVGLQSMDLIRPSEVCYGRVIRTKYGYVVQDDNYRRHLKHAKAYFEEIGIPLCGRVAEFEYINMDACIERAQKLSARLNRKPNVTQQTVEAAV